jgi:hypothetical protein
VLTLLILAAALYGFVSERLAPDVTALLALLALLLTGVLTPGEAFSGFSHPATISVAAVLVLSAAIERTGALTNCSGSKRVTTRTEMTRCRIIWLTFTAPPFDPDWSSDFSIGDNMRSAFSDAVNVKPLRSERNLERDVRAPAGAS